MKQVTIYTDGACSGNPGPGGWAAVLLYGEHCKEIAGAQPETTNQRMELTAVIEGLKALKVQGWNVMVHTDSAYLVNAFDQGWLDKWQKNGWKNSRKEEVANQDLWMKLLELGSINRVNYVKVKGHAGDVWNERCDVLAREAIKKMTSGAGQEE